MAEVIPHTDEQSLHHFLSNSPWDESSVIDQVAHDADQLIGGQEDSCLLIDETSIPKKGTASVGVSRQWSGTLGKVDNCQVGVFAVLGCRNHSTPIDVRLYLPEAWTDDRRRCLEAGVPEEALEFHRKQELALQMVIAARIRGVRFNWVGCDGLYGADSSFLRLLDQMKETFMADVHKDQQIYLKHPKPSIPKVRSTRGRKPSRLKAQVEPFRVDKWLKMQPKEAWKRIPVRHTTKGILWVDILHKRVWLWDGKENQPKYWHLIVRRDLNGKKVKYSLCNAPSDTPIKRLAFMQAQRYWVERSFQDSKRQCGLDEYQARGWRSWHHHMALVMMAMLFMLEQRTLYKGQCPLLSYPDIIELLQHFLPKRTVDLNEFYRILESRHKKRASSIKSAYNRQDSS